MMKHIDWNEIWKEGCEKATRRRIQGDPIAFWNKMAKHYNDSIRNKSSFHSDHAARVITKLDIDSDDTVMDIGSGPGTLAIPIAKIAKCVTVVEPSTEMLSCLKMNAREASIANIRCINKRWEDAIAFKDLDKHDILIASYSLSMMDMKAALFKMNELATKYVYLFTFAAGPMHIYEDLWPKLHDEEYINSPDYICIYNILHDMGIYANVEITRNLHNQRFSSIEEAAGH